MGKASRLEGKAFILSGERDFAQGGGTNHPYIRNELFQVASGFVQGY